MFPQTIHPSGFNGGARKESGRKESEFPMCHREQHQLIGTKRTEIIEIVFSSIEIISIQKFIYSIEIDLPVLFPYILE